ncbi:hypothetical protein [Spirosoma sp. KNUC1025]|uniref:hypothetical protein n=1 Tax=Spirosoma sp. KNUC1025 TaxID=2894082 RepID=UPI00386E0D30|nr:hypothetical protein LN737_31065 [Spirosoma sp. KNUC1025]
MTNGHDFARCPLSQFFTFTGRAGYRKQGYLVRNGSKVAGPTQERKPVRNRFIARYRRLLFPNAAFR